MRIKDVIYRNEIYEHVAFITVGFISGLICCLYAIVFSKFEQLAIRLYSNNLILNFLLSPILILASYLMVKKLSPGTFGSGIPQVIVCISKKHDNLLESLLGLRVLLTKLISSLLGIFSGAAIGREGPSLQISASVGYLVAKFFEKGGIQLKTNQLILAGSAGGLAAAFNTPIGGIVYAVEELAHDHIKSYKTVLLMSVLIAGFTAQLFMGNYLYLGFPKVRTAITFKLVFAIIFVGFTAGLFGGLFSSILFYLIGWRNSLNTRRQFLVLLTVGVSIACFFQLFGQNSVFSGKESINFVLFDNKNIPYFDVIFRFISPILSSMTGIAGGIFAPSLAAGSTLGGFLSQFFDFEFKSLLGLVGMIGFLNGVTKAPITSFVLVLEMTDRHSSVFPMMMAAIFSSLGSHLISHESFYERSARRITEQT